MTSTQTQPIATAIAQTIIDDLRSALSADPTFHPRIWQPEGTPTARIYTGYRSEYLAVAKDGRVTRSQARLRWGHVIDDVLSQDAAKEAK